MPRSPAAWQSNQKIVLLSDGVVEARSATGELLGFERLAQLTLNPRARSPTPPRPSGRRTTSPSLPWPAPPEAYQLSCGVDRRFTPSMRNTLACIALFALIAFLPARPSAAQAIDTLDPALKAASTASPPRCWSRPACLRPRWPWSRAASWSIPTPTATRGWPRIGSRRGRHARDALLHRVDLKAIHGGGDSAAPGTRQALAGRRGGQVRSRPDARQRGHHPADSLPHLRLPGLLARRLRDDAHAAPESAQQILDTWGKKPLDFEPGTQWQYSNTNYVIAGRIVETDHRRSR